MHAPAPASSAVVPTFRFGDVRLSAIDLPTAIDKIVDAAARGEGGYLTLCNTHSIVESATDPHFRDVLNGASMNLPDGMPTVWIGKFKGCRVERVDGLSLFEAMLSDPRGKSLRHYFYGGSEQALARLVDRATSILGAGRIAGAYSPPMRSKVEPEEEDVIARIAAAKPDLIWVGLGLPKQEYWMARHSPLLPTSQMLGIGAAFDFFAGEKPRSPAVLQRLGFEWAFRLAVEPRRLWRRYFYVIPRALLIMGREVLARWLGR